MGWTRRLRRSLSIRNADFDEEARFHLERRVEQYIENGMSPDEARREALRRFGNLTAIRERTREADMFRWIDDLRRDLGYGLRMLRRNPGFSLLAILCLTIGIGANAAVFSWIEGVLLRPFPLVAGQDRLFAVTGTERGTGGRTDMSWPDWLDLQRSSTLVDAFIADKITGTTLGVGDRAERAPGSIVSANYFDAIGVHPTLGRGFRAGEDIGRNAHPVTVISYEAWQDRFGGDPGIIGRTQRLNGLPHTIVGVAPRGFYGTFVGYAFEFWVPASMQAQFSAGDYRLEDRGARWIEGFVRLKPGVTREQAQAELSGIMSRLEAAYPETNRGVGIRLYPLWQTPFNAAAGMLPTLAITLAVVVAVLFIACANVGNLLLVRAFGRQQEMTIRQSIGAGRARLVRQLLTEGVLLAAIASCAGFLLANWLRDALPWLSPTRTGVAVRLVGALDWRVIAASAAVCAIATLLFGVVPALVTSQVDLAGSLRCEGGAVGGSRRVTWMRSALVVVQIAMSVVLLVGAGLLIRTFASMRSADPGFSTDGVLTTYVDTFSAGYDNQRARVFQDQLLERLRTIAGVQSVAFSTKTPFSYASPASAPVAVDGYVPPPDEQPTADYNTVGPDYFDTLGIAIVSGRGFTTADDERGEAVAIVDQRMAAQFWRGADPVGSRLQANGAWLRVVGVARAIKTQDFVDSPRPYFYVPLRQHPSAVVAIQVQTAVGPAAIRPALVREVHALDAEITPGELITMREQIDRTTGTQRIALTMLIVFGAVALLLAAIGLYGVMAASVAQGTRQMALRMALGADPSQVMWLVLGKGLRVAAIGLAAGLAFALASTRLMGYLLYRVSPRDPITFGAAVAVVCIAAIAACFVPARRATRTDPVLVLRA